MTERPLNQSTSSTLAWNVTVAASFILLIYLPARDVFTDRPEPASYLALVKLLPLGIAYTLGVTLAGSATAIFVGLLVGLGKLSDNRVIRWMASSNVMTFSSRTNLPSKRANEP